MSSTIDLQVSPSVAELYAVIDVLVAVGLDLAHKDGRGASTERGGARLTREREGLDLALCMLGELAARPSIGPAQSAADSSKHDDTGSNRLEIKYHYPFLASNR